MDYSGTTWESSYKYSRKLLCNAKQFVDMNSKSRELKRALNAADLLPDDYEGKYELINEINAYAIESKIDLSKITGW